MVILELWLGAARSSDRDGDWLGLGRLNAIVLLDPAGMRASGFEASHARVAGHKGGVPVEPLAARALGPAGTSMTTTVGDMLRFATLHLDEPALTPLRDQQPSPRIHGWFDRWCLGWASFEWDGARAWG